MLLFVLLLDGVRLLLRVGCVEKCVPWDVLAVKGPFGLVVGRSRLKIWLSVNNVVPFIFRFGTSGCTC